jgi:hypothetical protein
MNRRLRKPDPVLLQDGKQRKTTRSEMGTLFLRPPWINLVKVSEVIYAPSRVVTVKYNEGFFNVG